MLFQRLGDGHRIPSVLRASSSPSCPCLALLLILSHLKCDRPKRDKWQGARLEQTLNKGGNHFSWAFCQPTPQCNVQTIVFVSPNNPHHYSEAHTIPLHPLLLHLHSCHDQPPDHSSLKPIVPGPVFITSPAFAVILGHLNIHVNDHLTSQVPRHLDHSSFEILTFPNSLSDYRSHPIFQLLNTHLDRTKASFYSQTLGSLPTFFHIIWILKSISV